MKSEFEFINDLKSKYSLSKVGDDCAILPKDDKTDLLLTADMLVEDVDFRLDWTIPEYLGHKALAVSLSDIAAMGGTPKWALISIAAAENLWKSDFLDRFYAGWHELASKYKIELVGGDVSRSSDKLVIDSIVGGEVAKEKTFLRSTARPGDLIFVSGNLGGAAGGLRLLEQGVEASDMSGNGSQLLLKQLKPLPQLNIAKYLIQLDISITGVDLSDGLSSDLAHICGASRTGARIYAERLPIDACLPDHFTPRECLEFALDGGEDFELLFTAAAKEKARILEIDGISEIGEVTENVGRIELVENGKTKPLVPRGYRHF